jgi:hypothetical protein
MLKNNIYQGIIFFIQINFVYLFITKSRDIKSIKFVKC